MPKPTTSVAFQLSPRGVSDERAIEIIDAALGVVQRSGISYEVGPMETAMEGDIDEQLGIIRQAIQVALEKGAPSVFVGIKILHNPQGVWTMNEKVTKFRT